MFWYRGYTNEQNKDPCLMKFLFYCGRKHQRARCYAVLNRVVRVSRDLNPEGSDRTKANKQDDALGSSTGKEARVARAEQKQD